MIKNSTTIYSATTKLRIDAIQIRNYDLDIFTLNTRYT